MIHRGADPDWLMTLDLLSFNALVESSDRIESNREMENAWLTAMAFNDPKALHKLLKQSRKGMGHSTMSGDDLAVQMGGVRS